jgi:putative DNA primase/helicase
MQEVGRLPKAGQTVRLLDVPAARVHGAWDELHDLPSGTAFSDAVKRAVVTHHGHAGRDFLEKLTRDHRDFCAYFERFKGLDQFTVKEAGGQARRTAARFALLALAGELATEYGITGWSAGAATKAAAEGFKAWRALRGNGNDEWCKILAQVSAFIERHGDSRFSKLDSNCEITVRDRAGWWEDTDTPSRRVYHFAPSGMREALKGYDFGRGLNALEEAGALPKADAEGKRSRLKHINGRSKRLYPLQPEKLGE